MTFSVFIISSMTDSETVNELKRVLNQYGIQTYTSHDFTNNTNLVNSVRTTIMNSDCILAIITRDSKQSRNVDFQIGVATGSHKLIIPIIEKGSEIPRILDNMQYIEIDKQYPKLSYERAAKYLSGLKIEKENRSTIGGLLLLGLGLVLLGALASGD